MHGMIVGSILENVNVDFSFRSVTHFPIQKVINIDNQSVMLIGQQMGNKSLIIKRIQR